MPVCSSSHVCEAPGNQSSPRPCLLQFSGCLHQDGPLFFWLCHLRPLLPPLWGLGALCLMPCHVEPCEQLCLWLLLVCRGLVFFSEGVEGLRLSLQVLIYRHSGTLKKSDFSQAFYRNKTRYISGISLSTWKGFGGSGNGTRGTPSKALKSHPRYSEAAYLGEVPL